jgi:hypothetical protein
MCNCNKGRKSLAASSGATSTSRSISSQVAVKLTGAGPITITGSVTGKIYSFRKTNDVNMVDKRDAVYMRNIGTLSVIE